MNGVWYWVGKCMGCGLTIVRKNGYTITFVCSCSPSMEKRMTNGRCDDMLVLWDEVRVG